MASVVLLSGGMDSAVLLGVLSSSQREDRLHALTVLYGQRHSVEVESAAAVAAHYGVPHEVVDISSAAALFSGSTLTDLPDVPDGEYEDPSVIRRTVVPNRNMVMISLAVAKAVSLGGGSVYYAAHAGDHEVYPDCRPEFFRFMAGAVALSSFVPVALHAPFIDRSKGDIAVIGHQLEVPLHLTYSCYRGRKGVHCGTCPTCRERKRAMHYALERTGKKDPTVYAV